MRRLSRSVSIGHTQPAGRTRRIGALVVSLLLGLAAGITPVAASPSTHLVKDINRSPDSSDIGTMNGSVRPILGLDGNVFSVSMNGSYQLILTVTAGPTTTTLGVLGPANLIVTGMIASEERVFVALGANTYGEYGSLWVSDGTPAGTIMLATTSWASGLTDVDGTVFYASIDMYLSRTDGTPEGTRVIFSGMSVRNLVSFNGKLYFESDGDLWSSDGTYAGTVLVKDLFGGESHLASIVSTGQQLFFIASPAGTHRHDQQLWVSDGTGVGTHRVKDLDPTRDDVVKSLRSIGHQTFFVSRDQTHGLELWRSDGTATGTRMVKNLNHAGSSSPADLIRVADRLFFTADDGVHGRQLWVTSGTAPQTMAISSRVPFPDRGSEGGVGSRLFFATDNAACSTDLWVSDGTAAGTKRVGTCIDARDFADVDGVAWFRASDGQQRELWKSNGTAAGTLPAVDVNQATLGSSPSDLTVMGTQVFFSASDATHGRELWRSDGTSTGTHLVMDIRSGSAGSDPSGLVASNGKLYFIANDSIHGSRVWMTDGTRPGTVLVGAVHGQPMTLTPFGTRLLVVTTAKDRATLWLTDGTTAGTTALKVTHDTIIESVTVADGIAYFQTVTDNYSGPNHWHLWKTDGTVAGTRLVWAVDHWVSDMTAVGSTLFFTLNNENGLPGLWASDGTATGTRLVKSRSSWSDAGLRDLTPVSGTGTLYFSTSRYDPIADVAYPQLWKSDGTTIGTVRVKELPAGNRVGALTAATNSLFFKAWAGGDREDVWVSDGTPTGTLCVGESVSPIPQDEETLAFAVTGDRLFFAGNDGVSGTELWTSDGTPAGTAPLAEVNPVGDAQPMEAKILGGTVLFDANDGSHGSELWTAPLP